MVHFVVDVIINDLLIITLFVNIFFGRCSWRVTIAVYLISHCTIFEERGL